MDDALVLRSLRLRLARARGRALSGLQQLGYHTGGSMTTKEGDTMNDKLPEGVAGYDPLMPVLDALMDSIMATYEVQRNLLVMLLNHEEVREVAREDIEMRSEVAHWMYMDSKMTILLKHLRDLEAAGLVQVDNQEEVR